MAVTSERTRMSSKSALVALVLVIGVFALAASTGDALVVVNKLGSAITVFVPPICRPCSCPVIICKKAPCPQNCPCPCQPGEPCPRPDCFCTKECKLLPGVVVEARSSVILALVYEIQFPLPFVTVETKNGVYVVPADELGTITRIATVVVTYRRCKKDKKIGIAARVYPNPKFSGYKLICLLPGERYGS